LVLARVVPGPAAAVWVGAIFSLAGAAVSAVRLTDLPQPKE